MSSIKENIEIIRNNIAEAVLRTGRNPAAVRLMAVTKTVDDERIFEAIETGVDIIGENYIQEAKRKIEKMGKQMEWHMIGHLQTNKAKYAVRFVDMIHSVDRLRLAAEINRKAEAAGRIMKILIEVNLSGEDTKSGVGKEDVMDLVRDVAPLKHVSIQGLMTMPPWSDDPEDSRPYFRELRLLRDRIAKVGIEGVVMKELSMGMTDDYIVAVEEGATIVRMGRAIFGPRS